MKSREFRKPDHKIFCERSFDSRFLASPFLKGRCPHAHIRADFFALSPNRDTKRKVFSVVKPFSIRVQEVDIFSLS